MRGRGGGRGGPRGRLEAGSGDSEPAAPCETPGVLLRACSGALRALRGCHRSAHTPGGLRGWQRGRAAPLGACCLAGAATKLGSPPPGGSRGSFLHLVALKLFSQIGSYPIAFSPQLTAPFSDPRGSPVRFPCLERIPCSAGTPARPPPPRSRGRFLPRGASLLEQHRARHSQVLGVPPDAGAVSPAWSGGGCGFGTPR